MIRKGIILAGGTGTRLSPLTKSVNKQLLPIYDKPLIFYPLSILMLSGIKNILIIVNRGQIALFKKLLGSGERFGVKLSYKEQNQPNGLPEAFILGEKFIAKDNVALILGDNFFYGQNLTKILSNCTKLNNGAKVLLFPVHNPTSFGIAYLNKNKKIIKLVEKPKNPKSNLAITGLYFFDNKVCSLSKKLRKSKRGELEIIELLNAYKKNNRLKAEFIGRGAAWLDTGSIKDYNNANTFVSVLEERQGYKVACLEEIAFRKQWINKKDLESAQKFYGNCEYSKYLKSLVK